MEVVPERAIWQMKEQFRNTNRKRHYVIFKLLNRLTTLVNAFANCFKQITHMITHG